MKLAEAILQAKGKHGYFGAPQPVLFGKLNTTSKYFFDSCCICAGGKCERCRAPDCSDRDWRKNGRDLP